MIQEMKPYPAYRDSGVEWLGGVPEHWGIRRLKRLAMINPKKSEASLEPDCEVTFLPMERVGTDGRLVLKGRKRASEVWNGFTYFRRSDVLVAKITPCFENGKGACLESLPTEIGFGSTEFHVLRASSLVLPQFLYRVTTLAEFRKLGAEAMTGAAGQQRVPESFVADFRIVLPPYSEQAAIVRFLDHVDRRIRRCIRAKQKLIALLNEQKQAIIQHAVTRGLDPDVRLKPSGVEWLGEVPEHWEVTRFGYLANLMTGFPFKSEGFSSEDSDIRLLRGINIVAGEIRWDSVVRWPVNQRKNYNDYEIRVGDVVMGMDRPIISSGIRVAQAGEADIPSLLLQRVVRITPKETLNTEFALLLLGGKSFADYLAPIFTGISVPHISPEQINSFRIALPPLSEQMEILGWLRAKTKTFDLSIEPAQREISLLREYRTRLIADVVTGKADVREVAARLPGEAEAPEPLDDDTETFAEGTEEETTDLDAVAEEVGA